MTDHLDGMQTDLDSLRDLLSGNQYSLDANTILGVSFGHWVSFAGLVKQTQHFWPLKTMRADHAFRSNWSKKKKFNNKGAPSAFPVQFVGDQICSD